MKFSKDNVSLDIDLNNQEEVLETIANKAQELGYTNNSQSLKNDFLEREKEFSTGFGNGVAIPHAKTNDIIEPSVFFVRLNNGVEWKAMDNEPVNLVIAIIVPQDASKEHLDTLAKLSRKIIHQEFIDKLRSGDKEEVTDLINEAIS